ncbi:restriction system modified-DNA reader domain-containing protein [Plantactinospora soyae]|uniref:RAMA domain-containing protein n=1 Tax=Plantactinospora soyae TaxID=1544732 RepID=A0A927M6D9_9ACTN|nr:hypothetical protein [Plantactinospora soyae]MBE1489018.1 hypothetical protein [Plantactinospora soyae]
MRRIEIDDEVYAHLEEHARGFEQPNDVLRRRLLEPTGSFRPRPAHTSSSSVPGALADLIAKGAINPGDTLSHVQVRKGRKFSGVVEGDGWIKTEVDRYKNPSPALGQLLGTSINGWANWTHDASGKTLGRLSS